jgi:hypothetical protein
MSRGHGLPASVASLEAIGPQDIYLTSEDQKNSVWEPEIKRHSDFAVYQRSYRVQGPFINSTIKETLKTQTMGDLISNAWLKCTLPALPMPSNTSTPAVSYTFTTNDSISVQTVIEDNPGFSVSNVLIEVQHGAGEGYANVILNDIGTSDYTFYANFSAPTTNVLYGESNVNSVNTFVADADFHDESSNVAFSNVVTDGGTLDQVIISFGLTVDNAVYVDQIGRAIIDKVEFRVGSYTIQTLYRDWYSIRDQLFNNYEQKEALKYMINGGQDFGQLPSSNVATGPIDLFIPLELFFSHRGNYTAADGRKPYFPLCACANQEVELAITFSKQTYFTFLDTIFTNAGEPVPEVELQNVELVFEMIDVTPEEQNFWRNGTYTLKIPRLIRQPRQFFLVGDDSLSVEFIPEGLVKMTTWFFRSTLFENENVDTYYQQRFNFSTRITSNVQTQDEFNCLTDATFYLDGTSTQNFGVSHLFYKFLQAMEYDCFPADSNIYMKSFALRPRSTISSGNINMGDKGGKALVKFGTAAKVGSSSALLTSDFSVNVYQYAEMYLNFSQGQMTPAFSRD